MELGIIKIMPEIEGHKERRVEASFCHPHSMNEYCYGTFKDGELILESNRPEHFQRGYSAAGRLTSAYKRHYWINEKNELQYNMYMAEDGGDLYNHLENTLKKVHK